MPGSLVLLRHGQSTGNREDRFIGWHDDDLTEEGREQALRAARLLKEAGFSFDAAFTSYLKRAIRTLWILLDEMDLMWVPARTSWRLNERHYGALQGRGKGEAAEEYGEEQLHRWKRGYRARPPAVELSDPRYPANDARYAHLKGEELPPTESLEDVLDRLLPCWSGTITPAIEDGKRTLVVAHGNSLRALVKHLDGLSDEEVEELEIPICQPLLYEFDDDLRATRRYYLGEPD